MIIRFFLPLVSLFTAASIASVATAADSVFLQNGNSLTGKLTDSATSGVITLTHPDTEQPIKIKESAIEKIIFDSANSKNSSLTQSIKLLNGDHFPCTITELNDKIVSFKSDTLGNHTISRDKVAKINFNTKANEILYTGPGDDLTAWSSSGNDWKLNDGNLNVLRRSEISKRVSNLTKNYILEFKTAWEEATPHLRVCFSSDSSTADKKSDFYYIDLNSHGITIYRSRKGQYDTLTQVLKNDELYGQSKLHVALHVDRKNQKMALYLNGKLAKTISDPQIPPTGNYIVIKNLQRTGVLTQIGDIKISSWGGKVPKDMKSKVDALARHDLITDLSGNVMTGEIIGLEETEGKTSLNFKAPFAKKNSNIPGSAIDLLEFKIASNVAMLTKPMYRLNLVSGGIVSFSSSQITDGKLSVKHPYLGEISLPMANLSSVVRIPEQAAEEEEAE